MKIDALTYLIKVAATYIPNWPDFHDSVWGQSLNEEGANAAVAAALAAAGKESSPETSELEANARYDYYHPKGWTDKSRWGYAGGVIPKTEPAAPAAAQIAAPAATAQVSAATPAAKSVAEPAAEAPAPAAPAASTAEPATGQQVFETHSKAPSVVKLKMRRRQ